MPPTLPFELEQVPTFARLSARDARRLDGHTGTFRVALDSLTVAANLDNCDDEFTVQEVSEQSKKLLKKPFSPSHVNQMLAALTEAGLVYKNRHGKYSFAVPLLGRFILRQQGK